MLKVRQDIDLKELEKYGFEKAKDIITNEFAYYQLYSTEIDMSTREIKPYCANVSYCDYELVYDLIKANIIVKE